MGNRQRQRGRRRRDVPLRSEDLSESDEPSVSARFAHHCQREREQEGRVETASGGGEIRRGKSEALLKYSAVWREGRGGIPIRETDEGTAEDDSNI
ncbi:unnamed protein product [Pleuronectes platessa]|uniref:Uncharacterized protein n=1 Tax=Pleuronectes platessa TaxID=8262 RepID=A0A9N7V2L2_PLEPL|nr:unnamed protein product [Pleuronectes platessa]